jgi:hypothetical protein
VTLGNPMLKWKQQAEFYLGERLDMDIDGEASAEEDDDDDRLHVKYEEIESAIQSSREDPVLRRIDVSDLVIRLEQKLSNIDEFVESAWKGIDSVFQETCSATFDTDDDETIHELKRLLQVALSPDSPISNVDPIGRETSPLTRQVLEDAIFYRSWVLRFKYAESTRERVLFLKKVLADVETLPMLPTAPSITDTAIKLAHLSSRLEALAFRCETHSPVYEKYETMLNDRTSSSGEDSQLDTAENVITALDELAHTTVLSITEEKLAVHADVLAFKVQAEEFLAFDRPKFDQIASLASAAKAIREGRSTKRDQLASNVVRNSAIDAEIREFALKDIESLCGALHGNALELYEAAAAWRGRADAVVVSLRLYGNTLAGEALKSPKLPAMVDLKRIKDLIQEYESVKVEMDDLYNALERVDQESEDWSSAMTSSLLDDDNPFDACLVQLKGVGHQRPKGIIVDPTRHVVENLDLLLTWHKSVKLLVSEKCEPSDFEDVLMQGLEIVVEDFTKLRPNEEYVIDLRQALNLITSRLGARSTTRVISKSKFESSELARAVLTRIVNSDGKEGNPLLCLLYVLWLCAVETFNDSCLASTNERGDASLYAAKALLKSQPLIPDSSSDIPLIFKSPSPTLDSLKQLIEDGEKVEATTREKLANSKSLLKESLRKADEIAAHFTSLKELQTCFRSRTSDAKGVTLDRSLEQELEHDIRVFSWLVSTCIGECSMQRARASKLSCANESIIFNLQAKAFQHPPLVFRVGVDDASADVATSSGSNDEDDTRVPWDVLVSLHDRIPQAESGADFNYVVLRVKELYEGANAWQEEISELTMLSLRGSKRRNPGTPPSNAADSGAGDPVNIIDLDKVMELSNHPILSKVSVSA